MRAALTIIVLLASPAVAADQFDLICKGKRDAARYRVDLTSGQWCMDACSDVRKIAEVTSSTLTLTSIKPVPPTFLTAYNRVDRVTGAWEAYTYGRGDLRADKISGTCEAAPFTGFPARKF